VNSETSSSAPPTLDAAAILRMLRGYLLPWVQSEKGALSLARDPWHVLEILAASPVGFRVILSWDGEEAQTDQEVAGIFTQKIKVIVSHNRGLKKQPGENLIIPDAERPALIERVTQVRDKLRGYVFPTGETSGIMNYRFARPFITPMNMPLDAFEMEFQLVVAITDVFEPES